MARSGYRPTIDEARADVERVAAELGRVPSTAEYGRLGRFHYETVVKAAGVWPARWAVALEALGLEAPAPTARKLVADSDLLEDLRRVAAEIGRPPTTHDYVRLGHHSGQTVTARWGTWAGALAAAGLDDGAWITQAAVLRLLGGAIAPGWLRRQSGAGVRTIGEQGPGRRYLREDVERLGVALEETVTQTEAAELLGVSRQAVSEAVHRGRLWTDPRLPGLHRLKRADVELYRSSGEQAMGRPRAVRPPTNEERRSGHFRRILLRLMVAPVDVDSLTDEECDQASAWARRVSEALERRAQEARQGK